MGCSLFQKFNLNKQKPQKQTKLGGNTRELFLCFLYVEQMCFHFNLTIIEVFDELIFVFEGFTSTKVIFQQQISSKASYFKLFLHQASALQLLSAVARFATRGQ